MRTNYDLDPADLNDLGKQIKVLRQKIEEGKLVTKNKGPFEKKSLL